MNSTNTSNICLDRLYVDLDDSMRRLRHEHEAVIESRKVVKEALLDGTAHYGINTGFGVLAHKRIYPFEPCLWHGRPGARRYYPADVAT
jgi:histidine ammonia-lyase